MKAAEIESVMKFEATTTKIDGRGFCFKLANSWTLTVGPDVWWITDNQTLMMDTYESILSKKNMRIMYDKFKKNVKNKQGHLIRLHMSIIRQTNGKTTTTIDLFMNRSCQPSFGLIEAKYIQDKGESDNIHIVHIWSRRYTAKTHGSWRQSPMGCDKDHDQKTV
jgi:hypothetical protein